MSNSKQAPNKRTWNITNINGPKTSLIPIHKAPCKTKVNVFWLLAFPRFLTPSTDLLSFWFMWAFQHFTIWFFPRLGRTIMVSTGHPNTKVRVGHDLKTNLWYIADSVAKKAAVSDSGIPILCTSHQMNTVPSHSFKKSSFTLRSVSTTACTRNIPNRSYFNFLISSFPRR